MLKKKNKFAVVGHICKSFSIQPQCVPIIIIKSTWHNCFIVSTIKFAIYQCKQKHKANRFVGKFCFVCHQLCKIQETQITKNTLLPKIAQSKLLDSKRNPTFSSQLIAFLFFLENSQPLVSLTHFGKKHITERNDIL